MTEKNLIKSCICGNTHDFTELTINNIPVLKCTDCGVVHQILENWKDQDLINFYTYDYHKIFQERKGVISYADRYIHDLNIANIRLNAYKGFLPSYSKGLDVGSSNSAFVHAAKQRGYDCWGLEPGTDIGDLSCTITGTLENTDIKPSHYDWITMHDSIEHMVDVSISLSKAREILKPKGKIIIDLPHFWIPEGQHHWKSIEHLWFFTKDEFVNILDQMKFDTIEIKEPVPGKLVFYAIKQV
jgi:hypothetical protein